MTPVVATGARGAVVDVGGERSEAMNTKTMERVLEIIHRHEPEGVSLWKRDHYSIGICGDLPFTDEERAELEELGVSTYDDGESWSAFL